MIPSIFGLGLCERRVIATSNRLQRVKIPCRKKESQKNRTERKKENKKGKKAIKQERKKERKKKEQQ